MKESNLSASELSGLIARVFEPTPDDRALLVLVDLPDGALADNPDWRKRRQLAAAWVCELMAGRDEHGLDVRLCVYRNVRANNADLPRAGWLNPPRSMPDSCDSLSEADAAPMESILGSHTLVLAPTELSATAPLKVLAPRLGFRAATMPGFSPEMVPALRLDYGEVNRRVDLLKGLLDRALGCDFLFVVDGDAEHELHLDLRHRTAHASGGLLRTPGSAGNLPSGEAYIVPYEGELPDDPSRSEGTLPVQHGDEVVLYEVVGNRAVRVLTEGVEASREAEHLAAEPAYGNMAELGLGVLGDFGISPIGEVLLDEKLGLHIAFGRSEHFGGQVGPRDFSEPQAVVHQDYVYIDQIQPRVVAARATLSMEDGSSLELLKDGKYVIEF